jgi:hypothetical protein
MWQICGETYCALETEGLLVEDNLPTTPNSQRASHNNKSAAYFCV